MPPYHPHPHFYATTQTWPPLGRYLSKTQTADELATDDSTLIATDDDEHSGDDDAHSDASDSSTETVQAQPYTSDNHTEEDDIYSETSEDSGRTIRADVPSPDQYWSCIACWNKRSSPVTADCGFCDETTVTIKRWRSSKQPVEIDDDGDEMTGEDVETPWICVDCENPKLFLGGDSSSVPVFSSFCANADCQDITDTVYAGRRASYCCRSCRYERPAGSHTRNVRAGNETISADLWNRFCRRCDELTDTIKLDPTSAKEWCCELCRYAREPPGDDEDEEEDWCVYCQQTTDTVEIDSMRTEVR